MKSELKKLAIGLRMEGHAITKIAKELEVAKSTVSSWVRHINLSELDKQKLLSRSHNMIVKSRNFRDKRLLYQQRGAERVLIEDRLYLAGCLLYWGEGTKSINSLKLTNSDVAMLIIFKDFLLTYFSLKTEELILTINCYTDLHSLEDIENYWMNKLSLDRSNLRKGQVNNAPKSSSNSKTSKLEWGTASLVVHRTDIVQEIYGAIQEYGKFKNLSWLG